MKYRRIDKDTVQCIVTAEDMEEYGLTLGDIFERNERAEGFFREMIEEAHDEVGYECDTGRNIAMQITPFKDDGMIVTISQDNSGSLKGFLEHMKEFLEMVATGEGMTEELPDHARTEEDTSDEEKQAKEFFAKQPDDIRIFEFASLSDVFDFAADGFVAGQVKSYLGKADGKFYLVIIKNRCSWKNFNKLSAKAFDYAGVIPDVRGKLVYLEEHGEAVIENAALSRLARICKNS